MPAQELPDGFYRASLEFTIPGPGGPAVITWGGQDSHEATPTQRAETVGGIVASNLDDIQSDEVTATVCHYVCSRFGAIHAGDFLINEPGNVSQPAVGPQVSVIFKKITTLAGRQYRGRWYIPGVRYDAVGDNGYFSGATLTTAQDRADDIMAQLIDADAAMYLLHSPPLVDPGPPPVYGDAPVPTEVTNMVVETLTATQRRRLR